MSHLVPIDSGMYLYILHLLKYIIELLQDILYRYPLPSESGEEGEEEEKRVASLQKKLVKLRGVFLTLSDVLGNLFGSSPSW